MASKATSLDVPVRLPLRPARTTGYGSRISLGVMVARVFATAMDNSIVNVAIPSIRTTPGATFAEAELDVVPLLRGTNYRVLQG
jgi:hypothetical protein